MHRVMVVGAAGLLGQYLMRAGEGMGLAMVGTYNETLPGESAGTLKMDISDPDSVARGFLAACPELVVLAAALTNVDQCEREPDRAYSVNMEGAFNVASECKDAAVKMVYVSTDYVFNGLKGTRYHEFDVPDPQSVYAKSKLEGERVTLDADPGNLVCRVSVLYGWNTLNGKSNFITWVIDSLGRGVPVPLYTDQYVSPTYAPAAARDILELGLRGARGIYHTSGPDCLSRHEIGLRVAEAFGLDPSLVRPVTTEGMPQLAMRPPCSCLAVDMAEAELGHPMTSLKEGLALMRAARP